MAFSDFYKTVSDLVGNMHEKGPIMTAYLSNAANNLDNSEVPDTDIIKANFYKTINAQSEIISTKHIFPNYEFSNFIKALQQYVENISGSVDSFLSDNNILVSVSFAEASEQVGYPIDITNIESVS